MRVLAIGVTGQYPGLLVPALASRGVQVRAFVHDPASMQPAEEALYRSDLEFTVFQPAMFIQGLLGGWQSAVEKGVFFAELAR
jgi:uncharacterized protein YbjT (DUF2867 family)